jgi:3-oxo-5alpha-steroid 4-dehydrogenase
MTTRQIDSAEDIAWNDSADVVVVGFGGAGACAAIQARECGADVLIVDRFAGGGTTVRSGGVIYAGGTRFQREAGYDDTAEKMYAYLSQEVRDAVRPQTLRRYCEESSANLEWLIAHGVRYASDAYEGKTTFPPEGKFLYYSGNEKSPQFSATAPPSPRGHRAVGVGFSGRYYFPPLEKAALGLGARLRTHERVQRLVIDRGGRVVGVEALSIAAHKHAEHLRCSEKANPGVPFNNKTIEKAAARARQIEQEYGSPVLIRARRGVILATGGFALNREMVGHHAPLFARNYGDLHRLGTLGSDGSGILLGQSAGGAISRMDSLYAARTIAPPNALLEGILVNARGQRFTNEDAYASHMGLAIAQQPDANAWLILPSASYRRAIFQSLFSGWHLMKFFGIPALINFWLGGTRRARSAADIAARCGIDARALAATIAAHDTAIRAGAGDAQGKNAACRAPLGQGPYHAVNMALSNRYALTYFMTLGGLTVDEDSGNVTRADGSVIEGLYAAGLTAVGIAANGYISGISLGDGVFAGRRAGKACAENRV